MDTERFRWQLGGGDVTTSRSVFHAHPDENKTVAWPRLVDRPPPMGDKIILCAHCGAHAGGNGMHELRGAKVVTVNGYGGGQDRNQRYMCLSCVLTSVVEADGLEFALTAVTARAKCRLSPGLPNFPSGYSLALSLQLP